MTKNLITNLERLFILKEMYLTVIWHRLKELLICSIIMSVIICVLSVSGAMPKSSTLRSIERAISPILYIIWNIFMLRRCYIALKGNNVYYYSNLSAYLLFMAISLFEYHFISRKLYSWLFIITYIGRFSNLGISTYSSFAIFHSIMFISIFLAPIGLGWIKMKVKEEKELLARAPKRLDVNQLEKHRNNTEVPSNENKA